MVNQQRRASGWDIGTMGAQVFSQRGNSRQIIHIGSYYIPCFQHGMGEVEFVRTPDGDVCVAESLEAAAKLFESSEPNTPSL